MNPVVGGDCVPCNGSTFSNPENTLCGTFPTPFLIILLEKQKNVTEC